MTLYVIGTGEYSDTKDICLVKSKKQADKIIKKLNGLKVKQVKEDNQGKKLVEPNGEGGYLVNADLADAEQAYWIEPLAVKTYHEILSNYHKKHDF